MKKNSNKALENAKKIKLTLYEFYKSETSKAFNYPDIKIVSDGDICNYLKKEQAVENADFRSSVAETINMFSMENNSNTPDWILSHFIEEALEAFNHATNLRIKYYSTDNLKNHGKY